MLYLKKKFIKKVRFIQYFRRFYMRQKNKKHTTKYVFNKKHDLKHKKNNIIKFFENIQNKTTRIMTEIFKTFFLINLKIKLYLLLIRN